MKKMMSIVLACMYVLMLGLSLAGCGQPAALPDEKTAVGFVIAPTACSQGLNLSSPLVENTVEEVIRNYGWICVVNADGEPAMVANQNFNIDEKYKSASAERLKMDARSKATSFLSGMKQVIADNEEVDYLKSLQLCARNLSSLDNYTAKVMIVVGTGLSTTGTLNFQNNLLLADPETIADELEAMGEIPSLENIHVYWQQLGDTKAPQADMNGQQKQALKDIWRAIIERGGGTVEFDEVVYQSASNKISYPMVSVVELPPAPVINFNNMQFRNDSMFFGEPVALFEDQIRFVGDSSRYVNAADVNEILSPIAEILKENPSVTIMLCGCTAGDGSSSYAMKLSRERAEAVKETLMDLSVPEDQLIAIGLGSANPWHIRGVGLGPLAAQNRKVVLLNVQSELGKELLNS